MTGDRTGDRQGGGALRFGAVDLTNCDREPIHVPGSIQPHGVLLALDPQSFRVSQAGGDTGRIFGADPEALLGRRLEDLLGPAARERVARLVTQPPHGTRPMVAFEIEAPDGRGWLDVFAHPSGGVPVLELEARDGMDGLQPIGLVWTLVDRLQRTETLAELLDALAAETRAASGFDRVMVYRFEPDESGTVIAEARRDDIEPFLGLRYPASDIPRQAREMYRQNWLRFIPDVRYRPAPILPELDPATGRPLDLTNSLLRSVSPLHLEYLANMGVAASMSLSLVVEGRLWGLIACHHMAPRPLPQALRTALELFAQTASLQLSERLARTEQAERLRAGAVRAEIVEAIGSSATDVADALAGSRQRLMELVRADGVAVLSADGVSWVGRVPEEGDLVRLSDWLATEHPGGVFATHRLPHDFPPAAAHAARASGLLTADVPREQGVRVLWFRRELVETVTWAGNPTKPVEVEDGGRLGPRRSFAAWRETIRGQAEPWRPHEIEAVQGLRAAILELALRRSEEVEGEREAAKARQDVLMAELDHRVKNMLATIQALVNRSASGAASLEDFAHGIRQRLHAMARIHTRLTLSSWEGADIRDIVEEELSAFAPDRWQNSGLPLRLKPRAALGVSLALHELAANAARHGALSVPEGRVEVSWEIRWIEGEEWLVLDWAEHDGPPVAQPERSGFGRNLLEMGLAFEVDGKVDLKFGEAGVTCRALVPADQVATARPGPRAPGLGGAAEATIRCRRILLVEDQALIAMDLKWTLEKEGAVVVGPVNRIGRALEAVETEAPDAVLLDIDLHGEHSWPVADRLVVLRVPFAFTTGYQAHLVMPKRFAGIELLSKPYPQETLLRVVGRLIAQRDAG